ncbi:hypothetical protein [Streptomyces mirabilis]|uniref:hypothetical protein n=1 Tax=Streptomyces mirabilis TaxID=68239 RepID=UPI0036B32F4B
MIDDLVDAAWDRELNDLFLRIGHRFGRAECATRVTLNSKGRRTTTARLAPGISYTTSTSGTTKNGPHQQVSAAKRRLWHGTHH